MSASMVPENAYEQCKKFDQTLFDLTKAVATAQSLEKHFAGLLPVYAHNLVRLAEAQSQSQKYAREVASYGRQLHRAKQDYAHYFREHAGDSSALAPFCEKRLHQLENDKLLNVEATENTLAINVSASTHQPLRLS